MCGGPRQFVGARAYLNLPMRSCHENHVDKPLFKHGRDLLGPEKRRFVATKNRPVCGKLRSRQISTRFDPYKNICSSTEKNRLLCGSLKNGESEFMLSMSRSARIPLTLINFNFPKREASPLVQIGLIEKHLQPSFQV